jgi:hypothetical protein
MTFMQSSSTEFVSMYVTGQASGDALGIMQTPVRVKQGQAAYGASFDASPFRAGDYSGITVDPNDGTFWAANEYAKTPGAAANWGTWMTNFTLGAAGPDVTPPTATVTAPNGGESWTAGSTRIITWTASDNIGVTAIDLSYSIDGGANFTPIATGIANTGTYAWAVPNQPTANAFVKVVAYDAAANSGADVSNAVFTIAAPDTTSPAVTVSSPNGGESWAAGSIHTITWTASDSGGVTGVDLFYSTNGGVSFTAIATGIANTGSYAWTVPNTATTNAFVKAVAHDASGNTGEDLSNAAFTITAPAGNPNEIYVWDMAWTVSQKGSWITASVKLFVKRDSDGDGVAEASDLAAGGVVTTLVLDHYLSGLLISQTTFANAKTNGNGQVTFNLKTQYGGEFHAQVTSMAKSGWIWDAGLDQNNPSCYQGAPGGGEVDCDVLFLSAGAVRLLTATRNATGEVPPMLAHGAGPTLPAVAFQSESSLFATEEFIPVGSTTPRRRSR